MTTSSNGEKEETVKYRKSLANLSNEISATNREGAVYLLGKIHGLEMVMNKSTARVEDHTRYFGERPLLQMIEILSDYLEVELMKGLMADETTKPK